MKRITIIFVLLAIWCRGNAQSGLNIAVSDGLSTTQYTDFAISNDTIVAYGLGVYNGWPYLVLSKFDSSGNLLLSKKIDNPPGDYYNIGRFWGRIVAAPDGGYAMNAAPYISNSTVLIKVDNAFNVEFIKEYPDTVNLSNYFYKLLAVPNGYLIYGSTQKPDTYDDGTIRYVDKAGETIWLKSFSSQFSRTTKDIRHKSGSVYIASFVTDSNAASTDGFTSFLEFDLSGNEFDFWHSEVTPDIGFSRTIIKADSTGILHYGRRPSGFSWGGTLLLQPALSRLNSDYEEEWVSHFGKIGSPSSSGDLYDFVATPDGNYIGAGKSAIKTGSDPSRVAGWLYKFSPQGDSIWDRKIDAPYPPPVYDNSGFFAKIGVLSSGNIIMGGTAEQVGIGMCWLVKMTLDGCLDTLFCQPVSSSAAVPVEEMAGVSVSPNPAENKATVLYDATQDFEGHIFIYDIKGALLRTIPVGFKKGRNAFDLPDFETLPAGFLNLSIFGDTQTHSVRVIKK
jgi:hypothetical protein